MCVNSKVAWTDKASYSKSFREQWQDAGAWELGKMQPKENDFYCP